MYVHERVCVSICCCCCCYMQSCLCKWMTATWKFDCYWAKDVCMCVNEWDELRWLNEWRRKCLYFCLIVSILIWMSMSVCVCVYDSMSVYVYRCQSVCIGMFIVCKTFNVIHLMRKDFLWKYLLIIVFVKCGIVAT